MRPWQDGRVLSRLAMLLALGSALLPLLHQLWAWVTRGDIHYWLLTDNAYYYARMALSWHDGHGYSFNGIDPSNGFQPLWMLLVTVLALASGGSPTLFFLIYVAALAWINVLVLVWGQRLFRERLSEGMAWLAPAFLMAVLPQVFSWGMETLLAVPALYFLVARLGRPGWSARHHAQVGLALAWLLLVRLDSLVLLPLIMIWAWRHERADLAALLSLALPTLLAAALYVGANLAWFGLPLPVSDLAQSQGTPHFANFTIYAYLDLFVRNARIAPLLLLWLLAELAWGRRRGDGSERRIACLFVIAMLLQLGLYACFSGWAVWPWYGYFVVAILLTGIVRIQALTAGAGGAAPVRGGPLLARRLLAAGMLAVIVVQSAALLSAGHGPDFMARNYRDARAGLFAGKTIIMGDRAGSLAFWSPATRVVQTEGLVMSGDFLRARQAGQGTAWIDAHHAVNEVVVDRPWLPTMNHGGDRVYLIVEPIRALLWQAHPMVYCFPQFAVLGQEEGDGYVRLRFDYDERMTCPPGLMAWLNTVNRRGQLAMLSFADRPDGLVLALRQLDVWLASRWHRPPALITQSVPDPE